VTPAPEGQLAGHDGVETIDHVWIRPEQALEDHRTGQRLLGLPTIRTLRVLNGFENTDALMRYAHANPPEPYPNQPWPALRHGFTHFELSIQPQPVRYAGQDDIEQDATHGAIDTIFQLCECLQVAG
jgi:hypothetical protein